jgi:hypothetical protein
MTKTYSVSITDTEEMALSYVAADPQEWIDNAIHERCRLATEEIVNITVQKCLEFNIPIPNSKDDMVNLAFSQGWIQSAEQQNNNNEVI